MKISNKKTLILFFITILVFACEPQNSAYNGVVLANVADKVIYENDFVDKYKAFKARTGITDNGQARRNMLQTLVSEKLLAMEAKSKGYDATPEGKKELERINIQALLNAYHKQFISEKITISDKVLYKLFIQFNTKLKARHLYAQEFEQASEYYLKLKAGESFETLAKIAFNDPKLKNTGGDLGYFSMDEMDPEFEETAFALKIGEISKPVRTKTGYSIIRVDERTTKPLLTENEFAQKEPLLKKYWHSRQTKKRATTVVDSLKNTLEITYNKEVLNHLFNILQQDRKIESRTQTTANLPDWENQTLLDSKIGQWKISKFQELVAFTSQKQMDWVKSENDLKQFINGLVVRAFMLQEANRLKMHQTEHFQTVVAKEWDNYLIEAMDKKLRQSLVIPEDSIRAYYLAEKGHFSFSSKIVLREIKVPSLKEAETVTYALKNDVSFHSVATQYANQSTDKNYDGNIGTFTPAELGRYADTLFSLEASQWVGPIQNDSLYFFFQCVSKTDALRKSYAEARDEIENILKTIWWPQKRAKAVQNIRKSYAVEVFSEELNQIKILN